MNLKKSKNHMWTTATPALLDPIWYSTSMFSHSTPLLCSLYWLPVATRIQFKADLTGQWGELLLLTFKPWLKSTLWHTCYGQQSHCLSSTTTTKNMHIQVKRGDSAVWALTSLIKDMLYLAYLWQQETWRKLTLSSFFFFFSDYGRQYFVWCL